MLRPVPSQRLLCGGARCNGQVMRREAKVMRGEGDTVFAQVKKGVGVDRIKRLILQAYEAAKQA